jgi:hypothetical protein
MGGVAFLQPETVMPKMVESARRAFDDHRHHAGGAAGYVCLRGSVCVTAGGEPDAFQGLGASALACCNGCRISSLGLLLWLCGCWPVAAAGGGADAGVSGLIGGVGVVAWMEMVTRMVPERIRAAGWAARYIMQAVHRHGAGAVIHQVLTHAPGQRGYAVLHLIAFGFLFLSWLSQRS